MRERPKSRQGGEPDRLGPYRLLARLGAGGMGVVYLADRGDGPVAVKVLRPDLAGDPGFRARFRREVEAAARVAGARTARVLDADADGPTPYLVTEYVNGPTLWQAVAGGGPLRGARLEAIAAGVAEALATIHAAGLVHRDLKPGNVLLAGDGPKVIDFGIARAVDAVALTRTGSRFGTPAWMAPEQLHGGPVSPAADVFAWGGLVAFAASGRPPFGSGSPEAVAYRIVHQPADLGGLGHPLRAVVAAALAKDPTRRPSADQLLRALGRAPRSGAPAAPPRSPRPALDGSIPSPGRARAGRTDVEGHRRPPAAPAGAQARPASGGRALPARRAERDARAGAGGRCSRRAGLGAGPPARSRPRVGHGRVGQVEIGSLGVGRLPGGRLRVERLRGGPGRVGRLRVGSSGRRASTADRSGADGDCPEHTVVPAGG